MSNTCKYEKYRRWVSYDSGITWSPMDEYQKGELIERDSVDCGWEPTPPTPEVEYRWVDIPLADDFYCSGTTKYYKQKMQQSEDSGSTWTDVVPPQYRMGASAQSESSDCGYASRTTSGSPYCDDGNKVVMIYYQVSDDHGASWTTTSSTENIIEYDVAECGYATRTTSGSPYCVGVDKCVDLYHQVTRDGGTTWTTTSSTVSVIEYNSEDCGYVPPTPEVEYRWVDIPLTDDYYCSGTTKYYKQKKQQSTDSGSTWIDVVPAEYRIGESAETQSADCGYAERTTSGSPYCSGTTKVVDVYHQESEDSGTSWTTTSTTVSVIAYDSADCGGTPPNYRWVQVSSQGCDSDGYYNIVQKKQETQDGGSTWSDVEPLEERILKLDCENATYYGYAIASADFTCTYVVNIDGVQNGDELVYNLRSCDGVNTFTIFFVDIPTNNACDIRLINNRTLHIKFTDVSKLTTKGSLIVQNLRRCMIYFNLIHNA